MKINASNIKKLNAAIEAAQGNRVSVRVVKADDIHTDLKEREKSLGRVLTKKDMVGAVVNVDLNAGKFPASYNGIPESTHYRAERFASGWFVTGIYRARCKGSRLNEITLNDRQKSAVAAMVEKTF